jgi:peptidoglycan hydrolase-like protein with peptidoglycan-binding domain
MKKISLTASVVLTGALLALTPLVSFADHSLPENNATDAPATIAEHATNESECSVTRDLSVGSRGEDVECLQHHLMEDGFLKIGGATGYFGAMTKAAVIEWQKKRGINASGYFGSISRASFIRAHAETKPHSETTAPAMHAHVPIDVTQWPSVPSVSIKVHPDAMSGYNLEITTQNFRFAPEHASSTVVPNEGHAHLMVNGKKLARVYGNWFHIPPETMRDGDNEVLLTLNANDHSDLELQGARIEAKYTIKK